jgi:hypothetical protein
VSAKVLLKLRKDYSEDNWDGYGAKRVDSTSINNSLRFAMSLPNQIPLPEIDIVPSGQVVFSWNKGRRQIFSISVGSRSELSYAGLFGANKTYGVEYFNENIPAMILENIDRVFSS